MTIAQGTSKQFRIARQSALGTIASAGGGQILRRTDGQLTLQKETYNTAAEKTSHQQMTSSRHGPRLVQGNLNGLLSPNTYADFMQALLRKDAVATAALTGLSITIAASGSAYTLTRGSGSYLTGGTKIGDVVRLTAGSFATGNLNNNLLIINLTATVATVITLNGSALTAEGPIASATMTVVGKKAWVPSSSHTNIFYTVEEWMPDIPRSHRTTDVKVGQAQIEYPSTGNVTAGFSLIGLDQSANSSVYFTSPSAESTSEVLASASGVLVFDGAAIATIMSATVTVNGQAQPANSVVGKNVRPDVFQSKVLVSGQINGYFEGGALSDAFINENEVSLILVNTDGSANDAEFVALSMQRVKLNSENRDDAETGITAQYTFEALRQSAGGSGTAYDDTTIVYQDSLIP